MRRQKRCVAMRFVATVVFSMAAMLSIAACNEMDDRLEVARLRWDARDKPFGFIQFEPRLSWTVTSVERGQKQTAYQVLVASTPDRLRPGLADIWDSGKVISGDSIDVRYGGPTPKARQRAYWTVRAWGKEGRPSLFAAPSLWEMGLYDEEWEGQWIGRPMRAGEVPNTHDRSVVYMRRPFAIEQKIERARLYASSFGAYEIFLNGTKAGSDVLAPGFTDYEKRVLFQAYDVTDLVHQGSNVVGAIVGGGWCTAALGGRSGACGFEPPRVMLQLEMTLADGSLEIVMTDESWRSHAGPIVQSHLVDGEKYDARLEMPGWSTPGYDARDWQPVEQYDKEKERDLASDPGPPMRAIEELEPIAVRETTPGVYVVDFGQNVVGVARIAIAAPAGRTITLRYGEAVNADGSLHVANLRGARATDEYIARGGGVETWEPRFTLHGFRYVELRGLPSRDALSSIAARVIHSQMEATGTLETSNADLNRLFANIQWSQRGAFVSVPTRGPARDERLGSMLDAQVFAPTSCLNFDVETFYRKWIHDIRDAQRPNAAYSDTAPSVSDHEGGSGAGVAGVLVPWASHRCYGDRTTLDAHIPSMGRWLEWVHAQNPELVWTRGLSAADGDPFERGAPTDATLLATAEWAFAADAVAQMMRAAGSNLESSARRYADLARDVRTAFARRFVRPDGRLTSDTQSAYALAIAKKALEGEAL